MPTVNINAIEAGTTVYVNGIVDFSRIATRIEGEELESDNARKVSRGMRPTDKPHTRLTITHAAVSYEKGVDANGNPIQSTQAEQFIAEKFYQSKLHPDKGLCYTGMNKSKNLPTLYCRENSQSKILEPVKVAGELVAGTNVTLIMRFFKTNQNNGVSLDAVIVNQKPVQFGNGNNAMASTLAARGFQVMPASAETADEIRAQLDSTPAPDSPVPANYVTPDSPVPPVAAPYMQPAATVAPTPATPTTNVAPAPAVPVAPTAPASAVPNANVAPAPTANAAPSLPIPPKGYTYDENGRIVPESTVATGGIKL